MLVARSRVCGGGRLVVIRVYNKRAIVRETIRLYEEGGQVMDGAMLIALALVDSLSAGTLVIPIVLLLSWQQLRVGDYAVYLATIALSYGALGIALLLGVS